MKIGLLGENRLVADFVESYCKNREIGSVSFNTLGELRNFNQYRIIIMVSSFTILKLNIRNVIYVVTDNDSPQEKGIFRWNLKNYFEGKNYDLDDFRGMLNAYQLKKNNIPNLTFSNLSFEMTEDQTCRYFSSDFPKNFHWNLAPVNSFFKVLFENYLKTLLNGTYENDREVIIKFYNDIYRFDAIKTEIKNFCANHKKIIIRNNNRMIMKLCYPEFPILEIYNPYPEKISVYTMEYLIKIGCLVSPTRKAKLGHFCKKCTEKYCDTCYAKILKMTGAGFIIKSQGYSLEENLILLSKKKLSAFEMKTLFSDIYEVTSLIEN